MEDARRGCELCDAQASIYCPSDNAFLCYSCDSKVHCANFLVARHVRSVICAVCRKTDGNRFSGAVISPSMAVCCRNCSPQTEGDESDSLSSCSSCISSTGEGGGGGGSDEAETTSSSVRRKVVIGKINNSRAGAAAASDLKIQGVLVNWCKRIGFVEEKEIGQVVNMAVELINGCLDRITVLPFRISLATSFWVAVRIFRRGNNGGEGGGGGRVQTCSSACQDLKRVEQISGVPAKLILSTESKLARVIKRKKSREVNKEMKEGWAEC